MVQRKMINVVWIPNTSKYYCIFFCWFHVEFQGFFQEVEHFYVCFLGGGPAWFNIARSMYQEDDPRVLLETSDTLVLQKPAGVEDWKQIWWMEWCGARQEWCNHFPERQHDMFSLRQEQVFQQISKWITYVHVIESPPSKISKWIVILLDLNSFFDTIFRVEEFETSYFWGIGRDFEAGKWMMDRLLWQRTCDHCPLLHLEPRESELGKGARWSKNIKHVDGLFWKCTQKTLNLISLHMQQQ